MSDQVSFCTVNRLTYCLVAMNCNSARTCRHSSPFDTCFSTSIRSEIVREAYCSWSTSPKNPHTASHRPGRLGKIIPPPHHKLCRACSINLNIANSVDFSSSPPSIASKQQIIYTNVSSVLFKLSRKLTISPTALTFLHLRPSPLLNQLHTLFEVHLR